MNNKIIIDEFLYDISIPRTREQLKSYYDSIIKEIASDEKLTELARLQKGLFKEFFEELFPLLIYSKSRYCDDKDVFNIVVGNQKYDAIVKNNNTIKKLEFSKYKNGILHNKFAKQLNENGYTDIICGNVFEDQEEYLHQFKRCVYKKSERGYIDTEIIFVIDIEEVHRFIYDFNAKIFKQKIIDILLEASFIGNRIYLMFSDEIELLDCEQLILIK